MNKYHYSANVAWYPDDEAYVATCPEFPGVSALGETVEEAASELQSAIAATIETYHEMGRELPESLSMTSASGTFNLRLPKSLHARLKESATREGVSLNTLVVSLLSEADGAAKVASRVVAAVRPRIESSTNATTESLRGPVRVQYVKHAKHTVDVPLLMFTSGIDDVVVSGKKRRSNG